MFSFVINTTTYLSISFFFDSHFHRTVTKKPNGGRSVPRRELSDIQRVTEDMPDPRKRKTTSQFGHDDVKVEQKKAKVIRVPTNTDSVVYEILDSTVEEEDMDEEKAVYVFFYYSSSSIDSLIGLSSIWTIPSL